MTDQEDRKTSKDQKEQQPDFESVKARLAAIADAVDDEALSLDEALDLYEEAVALGLQASDLLETGIVVPEEPASAEGAADVGDPAGEGASASPSASSQESEGAAPAEAGQQPEPTAD